MPMIRPTALRSLQSTLRYSGARATARAAPARTQLVAKRFASSGGHGGHGEPSSDLPWLLAALVVTPPSCWYLWPDNSSHGHGDHGSHGEHHEEKHEKEEEEPAEEEEQASAGGEEEAVEDADEKKEDKAEVKEGGSEDKGEEKSDDKEEKSDDKEEKTDDKEGKSDDTEEKKEDGEEKEPEKVGASTSSSSKGMKIGETDAQAPAAKPQGKSDGDMSKKQEGMSNTDTKYSVPIDQGNEKSKKADGQPDTAKSKGTVDPNAEGVKPPVARD